MCNSVFLGRFTDPYNHHRSLSEDIFLPPKHRLCPSAFCSSPSPKKTLSYLSCLCRLPCPGLSYEQNHRLRGLLWQLLSLNVMFSGSLHVSVLHSSLWPNPVLLSRLTTFCLSVHPLMATGVVSTFWPLWMVLPRTFTYKSLCRHVFSCLLDRHVAVGLLGHTAVPCWIIWEAARLFPKAAVPFSSPTSTVWGSCFSTPF